MTSDTTFIKNVANKTLTLTEINISEDSKFISAKL